MEEITNSIIALGYQFVLIDCPAGIDVGFINAISPAREALIVTTPEITSIRDAGAGGGKCEVGWGAWMCWLGVSGKAGYI